MMRLGNYPGRIIINNNLMDGRIFNCSIMERVNGMNI